MESEPAFDFLGIRHIFQAIWWHNISSVLGLVESKRTARIYLDSLALLRTVCGRLVVQHRVPVYAYTDLVGLVDQLCQLLLRSPFRADGAFGVEFAQVI